MANLLQLICPKFKSAVVKQIKATEHVKSGRHGENIDQILQTQQLLHQGLDSSLKNKFTPTKIPISGSRLCLKISSLYPSTTNMTSSTTLSLPKHSLTSTSKRNSASIRVGRLPISAFFRPKHISSIVADTTSKTVPNQRSLRNYMPKNSNLRNVFLRYG